MSLAATSSQADDTALATAPTQAGDAGEQQASPGNPALPKNVFMVRQVRIEGNTLIPEAELLDNLPPFYIDEEKTWPALSISWS
jgi:hypothetical protein